MEVDQIVAGSKLRCRLQRRLGDIQAIHPDGGERGQFI